MRLKRFIKSFINNILFILNVILWIFNMNSLGEMMTGITVGKGRKQMFIYGLSSLVQYITYVSIIGLIITIWWWYKDQPSIAERISGLKISKK